MSIRSRTKIRNSAQTARRPQRPQQSEGLTTKAKQALKRFAGWVEKNQRDYVRSTGDTSSLCDDLAGIPIRVVRETGKHGREEERRIQNMVRRDPDEEIIRLRPKEDKKQPRTRLVMVETIKPKPKPKLKQRIRYLEEDPDAEVE